MSYEWANHEEGQKFCKNYNFTHRICIDLFLCYSINSPNVMKYICYNCCELNVLDNIKNTSIYKMAYLMLIIFIRWLFYIYFFNILCVQHKNMKYLLFLRIIDNINNTFCWLFSDFIYKNIILNARKCWIFSFLILKEQLINIMCIQNTIFIRVNLYNFYKKENV